jgi:uncharacterized protein (DUF302 family)
LLAAKLEVARFLPLDVVVVVVVDVVVVVVVDADDAVAAGEGGTDQIVAECIWKF